MEQIQYNHSPIFIAGALRSGTTLLRLMLDAHPNLKNPGEFDFFFDMIGEDDSFPGYDDYTSFLSTNRVFQSKNLNVDGASDFEQLIQSFVNQLSDDNKLLTLNVHRHIDKIPLLFPESKIVHMIRDPRDVARSSIGMGWVGHVYYGVDHWLDTEQSWKKLCEKAPNVQVMELRYEDLIQNTQDTLTRLCEFIGTEYTDNLLNYHQNSTYELPDPSLTYQWKRKLSQREIELVEYKASSLISEYRYELLHDTPAPPSWFEQLYLAFLNKRHRWSTSIKRYGLMTFIGDKLYRYMGMKQAYRRCKLRMNEIDKNYTR